MLTFIFSHQMDSRGWVPIALIASFNRVRQVTTDVQLVRDLLMLSSVVQVVDEWVRMSGWEQFVLPDALPSSVEEVEQHPQYGEPHGQDYDEKHRLRKLQKAEEGDSDGESDGEVDREEEEEDVVFVMTQE